MKISGLSSRGILAACLLTATASGLLAQEPVQLKSKINWRANERKVQQMLLARHGQSATLPSANSAGVTYWSGNTEWRGKKYPFAMLGTNPAKGSDTVVIPVYVIPVKIKLTDKSVFDPATQYARKGVSTIDATLNSPIFGDVDWTNSGVYLGTTQYIDAFQRASWWKYVSTSAPDYHVLFVPVLQPEVEWDAPASYGFQDNQDCPTTCAALDINWFDAQQQNYISTAGVPQGAIPFFLTYNTVLGTSYGQGVSVFAGAYHSVTSNGQPYLNSPWGGFASDLFILSHELGETTGDPFVVNSSPCLSDSNMEVGDPVEPYGFKLSYSGITYHLEDLVFYDWFSGQYPSTAVNQRYTFLGSYAYPCSYTTNH